MDRHPLRDFIVGLFVIAGLLALGYLSISIGGLEVKSSGGLKVYAVFDELAGLKARAPVMIDGVIVGEVTGTRLVAAPGRPGQYRARVDMDLSPTVHLTDQAVASILTEGVLGDRYLSLDPGKGTKVLSPGDEIARTESGMVVDRVLGRLGSGMDTGPTYDPPNALRLYALFDETAGLSPHAPVVISGVKVGEVTDVRLEPDFRARVDLSLYPGLQITDNAVASIFTAGLIGDHYVSLDPGGGDKILKSGDRISLTEHGQILERLLGKLVTSLSGGGLDQKPPVPGTPSTAPAPK